MSRPLPANTWCSSALQCSERSRYSSALAVYSHILACRTNIRLHRPLSLHRGRLRTLTALGGECEIGLNRPRMLCLDDPLRSNRSPLPVSPAPVRSASDVRAAILRCRSSAARQRVDCRRAPASRHTLPTAIARPDPASKKETSRQPVNGVPLIEVAQAFNLRPHHWRLCRPDERTRQS